MSAYMKANPRHDVTARPTRRDVPATRPPEDDEEPTLRIPLFELLAPVLDSAAEKG